MAATTYSQAEAWIAWALAEVETLKAQIAETRGAMIAERLKHSSTDKGR